MSYKEQLSVITPFNGPVEIGLRALAILNDAYPTGYSLQQLVIFDYLVVHSDDIPGGPVGLHPQTPHRGGELLVRRSVLEEGLLLYQSRGLLECRYTDHGVLFAATDRSAAFLDALGSEYLGHLRDRATWLITNFGALSDEEVTKFAGNHIGEWGAEFAMESVLHVQEGS
jgi:hypothetical protein